MNFNSKNKNTSSSVEEEENISFIPKEKFVFVNKEEDFSDAPLKTKPRGYFQDAMRRFVTNKGSLICFFVILILILFAFLTPFFSKYKVSDKDAYYAFANPRSSFFSRWGIWDGTNKVEVNTQTLQYLHGIPGTVKKELSSQIKVIAGRPQKWTKIKQDSYARVGWVKLLLTNEEYEKAREYEEKSNSKLFYPMIDESKIANTAYKGDANAWFLTDSKGFAFTRNEIHEIESSKNTAEENLSPSASRFEKFGTKSFSKKTALKSASQKTNSPVKNEDLVPIYLSDPSSPDGFAYSVPRMNGSQKEVRVLYNEWYKYKNGKYASFLFGADASGYDICIRLAQGARLSLILSICVAMVNLFLGIIIGAIEGYYGGSVDLIIERIKDILSGIPSVVLMTLFQLYLSKQAGPLISMFVAFIFFGWIGTSSTVRAQFYRFKGLDYVTASRTLGAKDSRLIFRHILPNAIGFIITTSVLSIPAVIFSEANLTYLGIVNLQSDTMTSVGTMLNNAQSSLSTHPHCVFFPAAFISILLVCFNEFGNGLRDAFNPNLRGTANE